MTTDFKQAHKEWMEKNPVRAFRKQNDLSIFACASALGVTTGPIQHWENGTVKPTDENMDKIAKMTSNPKVAQEWETWFQDRPQIA